MTDIVHAGQGGLEAYRAEDGGPIGLEDFGATDQVMPMLKIDHKAQPRPLLYDNLSKAVFEEMTVVVLGLTKQRVLWPARLGNDKLPPLCRSFDFETGYPYQHTPTTEQPNPPQVFPWEAAGFAANGATALPCASCKLKEWDTHPNRPAPWCTEQHCLAIMVPYSDGSFVPMLFQVQRTGLKDSRKYFSSFKNSGRPPFTVYTKITLDAREMSGNPYGVPQFMEAGETDQAMWGNFANTYRDIRSYLQTPRQLDEGLAGDDDLDATATPVQVASPTVNTPPAAAAPAPEPAPAPQPAPEPAPAPAPAPAPEPAPAPQPAPAAPVAQAAPAPAVAPAPAPQPAPVAAAPVAQAAPVAAPAAPAVAPLGGSPLGSTPAPVAAPAAPSETVENPQPAPVAAAPVAAPAPVAQPAPVAAPAAAPAPAASDEVPF